MLLALAAIAVLIALRLPAHDFEARADEVTASIDAGVTRNL